MSQPRRPDRICLMHQPRLNGSTHCTNALPTADGTQGSFQIMLLPSSTHPPGISRTGVW